MQEYCAAYCNNIVKGCLPPETQGQLNNTNIIPVVVDSARRISLSSSPVSSAIGSEGKKKVKRKETNIIQIRGGGGGVDHPQTDLEFLRFHHHQQAHTRQHGQDGDNHNSHHGDQYQINNEIKHHDNPHHNKDDHETNNNDIEESQHYSTNHPVLNTVENHGTNTTDHLITKKLSSLFLH